MEKKSPNDIKISAIVAFALGMLITVLCMDQMGAISVGTYSMGTYWWLSFIVINIVYVVRGMRKGFIKGDPAMGLVITTGPVAFYAWTIMGVWEKYGKRKE